MVFIANLPEPVLLDYGLISRKIERVFIATSVWEFFLAKWPENVLNRSLGRSKGQKLSVMWPLSLAFFWWRNGVTLLFNGYIIMGIEMELWHLLLYFCGERRGKIIREGGAQLVENLMYLQNHVAINRYVFLWK